MHSIRSIRSMDVNKFLKKSLAYFCFFFLASKNLPWTNYWEVEVLIPNIVAFVCSAMEVSFQVDEWGEYREDSDHLTSCMSYLGDNFAMNAKEGNEEGQDFYILLCTKTIFIV